MTAPRFELTSQRQRVSRLAAEPPGIYDTKFSGAKWEREIFIFPAQLTTSRIGNLFTRLVHTLPLRIVIHIVCNDHTYIHICRGYNQTEL